MGFAVVFGIFSTKAQAETAVDDLRREHFRAKDISVLFSYKEGVKDFGLEKGLPAGSASSVVIGGEIGRLANIGVLANPGLGPFIAAGTIMALLSGADSVVGGLHGALIRIGVPEGVSSRYVRRIKGDCILLSVHAEDFKWIRKARNVLEDMGADDIVLTGETKEDDYPTPIDPETGRVLFSPGK
jgi:hypothetical protein